MKTNSTFDEMISDIENQTDTLKLSNNKREIIKNVEKLYDYILMLKDYIEDSDCETEEDY